MIYAFTYIHTYTLFININRNQLSKKSPKLLIHSYSNIFGIRANICSVECSSPKSLRPSLLFVNLTITLQYLPMITRCLATLLYHMHCLQIYVREYLLMPRVLTLSLIFRTFVHFLSFSLLISFRYRFFCCVPHSRKTFA